MLHIGVDKLFLYNVDYNRKETTTSLKLCQSNVMQLNVATPFISDSSSIGKCWSGWTQSSYIWIVAGPMIFAYLVILCIARPIISAYHIILFIARPIIFAYLVILCIARPIISAFQVILYIARPIIFAYQVIFYIARPINSANL